MLRVAQIAGWTLAIAIVVLSIVPPTLRPETDVPHVLEHFSIFFATGLAFGLGYARRHDMLALRLVVFDAAVEIAQLFVPGRHARLSDFIVDAIATSLGVMSVSLLSWIRAQATV